MKKRVLLLLSVISLSALAQSPLEIQETFDFSIGDKFQYQSIENPPHVWTNTIVAKWTNSSTVYYGIERTGYQVHIDQSTSPPTVSKLFYNYADTLSFPYSTVPLSTYDPSLTLTPDTCHVDTSYQILNYCNVNTNGYRRNQNSCFEPVIYEVEYSEGLGKTRQYLYDPTSGSSNPLSWGFELTSYIQNGDTCGSFESTSLTTEEVFAETFSVYPNPTNGLLHVDAPIGTQLSILNSNGEVMLETSLESDEMEVDLSHLPKGVYFLVKDGVLDSAEKLLLQY
ncbi:MAG: T9SS type A sorting domain-containing protein [Flavobacteriia bacterium]|nr:T9SS type A sorting domain-containing protein [Flavobacteriia bacterium]